MSTTVKSGDTAKTRKSPKASQKASAADAMLKAALDAAQVEYPPLSQLVKSPKNVRTLPYTKESVRELADSLLKAGLLQNLIVHRMPDGKFGVAAGGRRMTALKLLAEEGHIHVDYPVAVKVVSDELAVVASITENEQRRAMHPAEQIIGFRTLASEGKTPEQIGDLLGYTSRHVQRGLRLASLAPELLDGLAKDELTLEQCQALALEADPQRQVMVWQGASENFGSGVSAEKLRRLITESEVSTSDNRMWDFVGEADYVAAGGEVRRDLFSQDEGGFVDKLLLEQVMVQKLDDIATQVAQDEGWRWSAGRLTAISRYDDADEYALLDVPEEDYTDEESARLDVLADALDALSVDDGGEAATISDEIAQIQAIATARGWSAEARELAGVVVSFGRGGVNIRRGVVRKSDLPETAQEEDDSDGTPETGAEDAGSAESVSLNDTLPASFIRSMTSERTFAAQAALAHQPRVALALMTWTLCLGVFSAWSSNSPVRVHTDARHYLLTDHALSGKDGKAYQALMAQRDALAATLPLDWKTDFTWLLARSDADIHALLAYCTAHALDGLDDNISARGHSLDRVEAAMDFDLREWWTPTADSYFRKLNKKQLSATLAEMGNDAAAREVLDMKKDTAAARAEREAAALRWLPDWMVRREAVTDTGEASATADTPDDTDPIATEAANDAATDSHHAA
ncbi:TPA: ParB/RepB/Spo0J family partition protein [Escherichia coli]|nr:ParB/RepB/Spo0J family partition protein [Escherichia coli]HAV9253317.1 ParB/RepB/Spo0J family partition protein [Escherichia coli]HAW0316542.1 ParB/RepB/Spo0J family partition protein [Escherichia coli]HAW1122933.1 ParB/RepB/Spo0J family partition protein [Escherichia coli]HCH7642687.1 ParB/RepB/Spo0J family partition protein [Escherichia coli]